MDSLVSIPQAVSAVATVKLDFSHLKEVEDIKVSIPQAVSAVATFLQVNLFVMSKGVSIPQAVSAVATFSRKIERKRVG